MQVVLYETDELLAYQSGAAFQFFYENPIPEWCMPQANAPEAEPETRIM